MTEPKLKETRGHAFVRRVIDLCTRDNGTAAALRRADNPDTENRSWAYLCACGVNIEKDWERRPAALIAAAVTKAGIEKDSSVSFFRALACAYPDSDDSGPGASRLRRLLACDSTEECCDVLRPMISLVLAKGNSKIDFGDLLDDLYAFGIRKERVRLKWAQAFYRKGEKK